MEADPKTNTVKAKVMQSTNMPNANLSTTNAELQEVEN